MITTMARDRNQHATPDLFSTASVRPSIKQLSATEAAADATSPRHVLPKDLPNAVKHLTDGELDLLIAVSIDEAKRRGRFPPSVETVVSRDERQAELARVSLTRGQV